MTDRRRLRGLYRATEPAAAPAQAEEPATAALVVAALTHDVARGRSMVTLAWRDDPEKKVTLPVPYGCALADIETEALKAVRLLAVELSRLKIVRP